MANRTMQAKVVKLQKQKRLFPKKYASEYIPVSSHGLSQKLFAPAAREFQDVTNSRAKSGTPAMFMRGTTSSREAEMRARHAMIQALWPSLYILPNGERGRNNEPRRKVLEKIDAMLKDVPIHQHVVMHRSVLSKAMMFWNSTLQIYFMARVDLVCDTFQRSVNYPSRNSVMHAWKRETIRWKNPIPLEESELGTPSPD